MSYEKKENVDPQSYTLYQKIPNLYNVLKSINRDLIHKDFKFTSSKNSTSWGLPDGPVAKTPSFQCRGPGFDLWPRTEEPGGLQSIGLQRVGHD